MNKRGPKTKRTLFRTNDQLKKALNIAIDLLSSGDGLNLNENDFCSIEELCTKIKEKAPELGYLTRNHIVEFYFKDNTRRILINDYDQIKYKEIRYVQPPDILYFGTLEHLIFKMKRFGIKSSTKGYLKLYERPEDAAQLAKKFINKDTDNIVVLEINAKAAFTDGMKFSTFKKGEYIVVRLNKKYIIKEIKGVLNENNKTS